MRRMKYIGKCIFYLQPTTVEKIARRRGKEVIKHYVYTSEDPHMPAFFGESNSPCNRDGKQTGDSLPKIYEIKQALSSLPGCAGYLSVPSLTASVLDKPVAVPMRSADRLPSSGIRTLRQEICLAVNSGVVHDMIRPVQIETDDHHVKGLPSYRGKPGSDIIGCIWTGKIVIVDICLDLSNLYASYCIFP